MKTNIAYQRSLRLTLMSLALLLSTLTATAQTTTFTYQGKLTDSGMPASGSYDFQFKLFDMLTGGSAVGAAAANGVTVTNGVFTVNLDFGVCASCFNGANRFIAISLKPTSGSTFTDLNPRQQITSTPYAIKSQNATSADGLSLACVSCVTSSQIGSVSGSVITGTIPVSGVPAGSTNYIQNGVGQQVASNFNISGDGTAAGTLSGGVVNANTQYNLAGGRVLSTTGSFNVFAGAGAGDHNTSGSSNAFFGALAGQQNTTASDNSFFGAGTGAINMTGQQNSFFGSHAGQSNTASFNSFFGTFAGDGNTTGASNSFFGASAGAANTTGADNSFFGRGAGQNNTTASFNSFFGYQAGLNNITGASNAFFGVSAGQNNTSGFSNAFFGFGAGFTNGTGQSNSFFGESAGGRNTTGNGNSFFGRNAGSFNTTGFNNAFVGNDSGLNHTTGESNSFFGRAAGVNVTTDKRNVMLGAGADFRSSQASSINAFAGDENVFVGYQAGGAAARRNAAAFGTNAFVTCDDCMVLGTTNVRVGIGMTTPQQNLSVNGGLVIDQAALNDGTLPMGANAALTFGSGSGEGIASKRTASGNQFGLDFYTNFINRMSITQNGDVRINHKLAINELGAAPSSNLCINLSNELSNCSSSLRYKTNVMSLNSGLELVHRLRPVTFDWKTTGQRDLGLIAEEVEKVEPLLVTRNKTGQIEGVKYDHLSVVFINAIKEQQSQITKQQTRMETQQTQIENQLLEIKRQQKQIENLLKVVCLDHPGATLCKPKE
ncbi:MAG TPA: tail fiber domain-containing protein [Blastocatellia bacterium]|nr:tail fiber domain-containing protein [Blastocatellia bacterium]